VDEKGQKIFVGERTMGHSSRKREEVKTVRIEIRT
jgi:hypothetical protein